MTLAAMIKKTRLDNHMTQEEYGNKFGVTRQTVSSWENERSVPDLQLLITICNTYNLSLDLLLNEDHKYVSKITAAQKIFRILKRMIPVFCIVVCILLISFGVWKINAEKKNAEFAANAAESGFVLENGRYILYDQDVVYELPNQKLPFMKFRFNVQKINAIYESEKFTCSILLDYDDQQYAFSMNYGFDGSITGSIANDGTVEYDNLSKEDSAVLNEHKDAIEDILYNMSTYYEIAYDLQL